MGMRIIRRNHRERRIGHAITAPAEKLHGWDQERDAEIETVTLQTTLTATPMRENVDS